MTDLQKKEIRGITWRFVWALIVFLFGLSYAIMKATIYIVKDFDDVAASVKTNTDNVKEINEGVKELKVRVQRLEDKSGTYYEYHHYNKKGGK